MENPLNDNRLDSSEPVSAPISLETRVVSAGEQQVLVYGEKDAIRALETRMDVTGPESIPDFSSVIDMNSDQLTIRPISVEVDGKENSVVVWGEADSVETIATLLAEPINDEMPPIAEAYSMPSSQLIDLEMSKAVFVNRAGLYLHVDVVGNSILAETIIKQFEFRFGTLIDGELDHDPAPEVVHLANGPTEAEKKEIRTLMDDATPQTIHLFLSSQRDSIKYHPVMRFKYEFVPITEKTIGEHELFHFQTPAMDKLTAKLSGNAGCIAMCLQDKMARIGDCEVWSPCLTAKSVAKPKSFIIKVLGIKSSNRFGLAIFNNESC